MPHAPCCPLLQPGPYKKRTDPWQDTQLKHFMRSFYSRTLDWLSQVGQIEIRGHACDWKILFAIRRCSCNGLRAHSRCYRD